MAAEREAICNGTPAEFHTAAAIYDARRQLRGEPGRILALGMPTGAELRTVRLVPADHERRLDSGRIFADVLAHSLGGGRSALVVWCEDPAWPAIEPLWRDLLAELARLGMIAEPEPVVATQAAGRAGIGPEKTPIEYRAEWVHKWRQSKLSAELFVVSEAGQGFGHSPQQLRRYAREPEVIAYIERIFITGARANDENPSATKGDMLEHKP